MDYMKVNTNDLRDAATELAAVAHEFKDADRNSAELADAVGEPTLANHITSFSMNWTQNREKMVKSMETLHKKLLEGADALDKADAHLAAEIRDHAPAHPSTPAPHSATPAPSTPHVPHGAVL
jgi:uncharacterized protein YukE